MINPSAHPNRGADLHRPDVCLSSLTPPSRNACKAVELSQRAHDMASYSGSASKNAVVFTVTNVHQNVHQRIRNDRIGYVLFRPDFCCKFLTTSIYTQIPTLASSLPGAFISTTAERAPKSPLHAPWLPDPGASQFNPKAWA